MKTSCNIFFNTQRLFIIILALTISGACFFTAETQQVKASATQTKISSDSSLTKKKTKKKKIVLATPKLRFEMRKNRPVIMWDKIEKAKKYKVYVRPSYSKKYTVLTITKRRYVTMKRFNKNTLYNIKVRAIRQSGTKTIYSKFQKNPFSFLTATDAPTLSSPSAGTLVIKWSRVNKAKNYLIQYGTDKNFENNTTTLSFNSSTTQQTIYDLKQNSTVYARILYSRTVGKTYTSKWSAVSSVKITDASSIINSGFLPTDGFFKDSVFIGDSVMLGFSNYINRHPSDYLDGAKVYGIGSYSLIHATNPNSALHPMYRGTRMTPENLLAQYNAKKVFLFFGINDVCTGYGLDGACNNYRTLINNIKRVNPNIQIYVISATYTLKGSRSYENFHARLHSLNNYMRDYCAANGYQYIDIATYLSDSNGDLKPEYCSDGFLHETWSAYEIWDKVLRAFAHNSK